jgi:hypothetical protein
MKETTTLGKRDPKIINLGFGSEDVYTVEAWHPDTKRLLGYIRFSQGTIEFTNFGARLSRTALSLGASSKRKDDSMAGGHGEGFKVGALIMVHEEYRVRIEATSFLLEL